MSLACSDTSNKTSWNTWSLTSELIILYFKSAIPMLTLFSINKCTASFLKACCQRILVYDDKLLLSTCYLSGFMSLRLCTCFKNEISLKHTYIKKRRNIVRCIRNLSGSKLACILVKSFKTSFLWISPWMSICKDLSRPAWLIK